ncbi:MAG: 3'(2'),5'-bisphosphate nucleotidase CysQ [Moraxellaceae bacterium]
MVSKWQHLLPDVLALATAAGAEIMAIYRDESRWDVQHKEDDSPLTAADTVSNNVLVPGLHVLTPDIPVISEEGDENNFSDRLSWPRCWLVDPLDGTKEFIARNDEFSVNIALIENHEAVLGLVYSPVSGVAYMAARGAGAFRQKDGVAQRLLAADFPGRGETHHIVASRRHRGARDLAFCENVSRSMGPVELALAGSAFKICAVAEGAADAYPRFGATMEWDTAAGQVVVEEAGGALVDVKGRPFRYNQRASLRNNSFLVVGGNLPAWLPAWQAAEKIGPAR